MDPFPLIVLGGILLAIGLLIGLAKLHPGSGADLVDWRPTRSYEVEAELETQDIQQMIDAQNEYRRKRGVPEITEEEVRRGLAGDQEKRIDKG